MAKLKYAPPNNCQYKYKLLITGGTAESLAIRIRQRTRDSPVGDTDHADIKERYFTSKYELLRTPRIASQPHGSPQLVELAGPTSNSNTPYLHGHQVDLNDSFDNSAAWLSTAFEDNFDIIFLESVRVTHYRTPHLLSSITNSQKPELQQDSHRSNATPIEFDGPVEELLSPMANTSERPQRQRHSDISDQPRISPLVKAKSFRPRPNNSTVTTTPSTEFRCTVEGCEHKTKVFTGRGAKTAYRYVAYLNSIIP